MKSLNIFFLAFCAFQQINGEISICVDRNLAVPRYISAVIDAENEKDTSRYHDVVLIRMEIATPSEIFEDILEVITKENPNNPVLVHDKVEPPKHRCVASASLIIIVSDINDLVCKFRKAFAS